MIKKRIILIVIIGLVFFVAGSAQGKKAFQHKFLSEDDYLNLPEEKIDLAEGALIIAKGFYPELDIQKYLDQIDAMLHI